MRRFVSWVGVLATVWVMAAVVAAQAKPSLEQLDRVMKKDGPAQQSSRSWTGWINCSARRRSIRPPRWRQCRI
jgi:hypothetical protein